MNEPGDKQKASERRTVDEALAALEVIEKRHVPVLLARLRRRLDLPPGSEVLEIGAAQGTYLTALTRHGFRARGVEPWPPAIEVSKELSKRTGVETDITLGRGEELPFESESFDLVLAISVMEHVQDPDAVFRALRRAGFSEAVERWDLVDPDELSGRKRLGSLAVQRVPGMRIVGAFASGAIAFLAIK